MTFFHYREGSFHAEKVNLIELADAVETPFYCYSSGALEASYRAFANALAGLPARIYYAVKANANQGVIATLARQGAGADVVSEGEMRRALAAGVPPEKIVFAGVGKTRAELAAGLEAGILQFNVESLPELRALSEVARDRGTRAPTALRINPDVDAMTHAGITTGKADNKFGIDLALAREIAGRLGEFPGIALEGLAVHIGSQMTDTGPYRAAFRKVIEAYREFRAQGVPLKRLDLGGGLGITYRDETPPDLEAYAAMVQEETTGLEAELAFEPGRLLVGNAGILVTRVIYVKDAPERRFVIVDAAMNDLIRPMLYEAWHDIIPLGAPAPDAPTRPVDVVGPICESTDIFARQRPLPPVEEGELLAICSTGAYSAVMASGYNSRLMAPEVLVRGGDWAVVRPRMDHATLIAQERLPDWLAPDSAARRGAAE
jgi:diaminopimelate decarboxylase